MCVPQPKKSSIPEDSGFKYTTRNNRAELLARYSVPDDARVGDAVSVVIGSPCTDFNVLTSQCSYFLIYLGVIHSKHCKFCWLL